MSQRRMFSPDIVQSDIFLEMPVSSQSLYFQLGMSADDDGFVNPRKIMRLLGTSEDDLRVLIAKRFVLEFKNGVIVIKHWLIHNSIRKDRYKKTHYLEEKSMLTIKENGAYTEYSDSWQPNGNQWLPQVKLGKVKDTASVEADSLEDDVKYEATDEDGNPLTRNGLSTRKPGSSKKNEVALSLQREFRNMCNERVGFLPKQDFKGYNRCLEALKVLEYKQIIDLFDDWFSARGKDEDKISLSAALSTNSIERFKVRENIV